MKVRKVFHLIPSLQIGGAETIVLNYLRSQELRKGYFVVVFRDMDMSLLKLLNHSQRRRVIFMRGGYSGLLSCRLIAFLIRHRASVIVTSMWPSAMALMVASCFARFSRHIAFTHRSTSAHLLDFIVRRWQIRHAVLTLADSEKSASWARKQSSGVRVAVLPAVFGSGIAGGGRTIGAPIRLCFIGRIAPVKNLTAILNFFVMLNRKCPEATLDIFGPDGGDLAAVRARVEREALNSVVRYMGVLSPVEVQDRVRDYDFMLLLSHTEGMAMSVVEAMRMGVVPIVGLIGGPSDYCRNSINAITVSNYSESELEKAADVIARMSDVPDQYQRLSIAASQTFRASALFETEFNRCLSECAT